MRRINPYLFRSHVHKDNYLVNNFVGVKDMDNLFVVYVFKEIISKHIYWLDMDLDFGHRDGNILIRCNLLINYKLDNTSLLFRKITSKLKHQTLVDNIRLDIRLKNVRNDKSSRFVSNNICRCINDNMKPQFKLRRILNMLSNSSEVMGYMVVIKGKLGGNKSRKEVYRYGRINRSRIEQRIDYSSSVAFNKQGTVGVKVWIICSNDAEK